MDLLVVAIIVLFLWGGGLAFGLGPLVHLLLIVVVALLIVRLLTGRSV